MLAAVTALPPARGHVLESLPHRDRHADRPRGVVGLEIRVVEEGHEAVAGEVLERALVLDDQSAHRRVVVAQESRTSFGSATSEKTVKLRKSQNERRDLAPVAGQELLAIVAGRQRRDLRRQEAGELGALSLDGLEQARVVDADGSLVGEGGCQPDLAASSNGRTSFRVHRRIASTPATSPSCRMGMPSSVR